MIFDWTISLGNVITGAGTIGGLLYAYHKWDMKIEIRHEKNQNEFDKLGGKVDRIEMKVDETRKDVNGSRQKLEALTSTVDKHLLADDLIQKDLARRLDKMDR